MSKVEFKYNLDDEVNVPLTDKPGMITMLGFDEGGIQYFVVTADKGLSNKWWKEKQVTKAS